MEVFNTRYYNIHKFYLKMLGLWPFNKPSENKFKRIVFLLLMLSLMIPQTVRMVEEWNRDMDVVIEVIGSLIYCVACLIKYFSYVKAESKMKYLYVKISRHWTSFAQDMGEMNIIEEFYNFGRLISIGYISAVNAMFLVYILTPLLPCVLDIVAPLNESRPKAFPYFAEYFVDDQKYYYELSAHGWIVFLVSVQIFTTFDTIYTQCVQHACGLFAVVERRLQEGTKLSTLLQDKRIRDETVHRKILDAVILHKEAIQFVDQIEACYSGAYFWIIILNTMIVSLAIVDTMLNIEKGNMKQAIRIGLAYVGFLLHLLFNMMPGQRVIDSSVKILDAAFHCEWYNASSKTKYLIKIILMRSLYPCRFTAGKMIVMNLESFGFVYKKSISYVTVVSSMRS